MNHPYPTLNARPNTKRYDDFERLIRADEPTRIDWWAVTGLAIVVVAGCTTLYVAAQLAAWWAR